MLSVCCGLVIFLATVRTTEDSPAKHNCNWSCEIVHGSVNVSSLHWKTTLLKTGQMKAKFQLNKRVEQDCASLPNIANTSESIEVWIAVRKDSSAFSLFRFAQINFFNDFWRLSRWFVFGSNSSEHEVNNISCVFSRRSSQKLNKSNGRVGLEAVYSPYFYLHQVANFSQEKPLIGYILSINASPVFSGFTNPEKNSTARLMIIVRWVVCIYFALYSVSFLLCNFQSNISTVEMPETPTSAVHPENRTEQDEICSDTARVQDPPPDWVQGVQEALSHDLPGEGALGPDVPSVWSEVKPTQPVEQEDSVKGVNLSSSVVMVFPELTRPLAASFQENEVSNPTKSKFVSGRDRNIGRSSTALTDLSCSVDISDPDRDSMVQSGSSVKLQSSPFRSRSENSDTFIQETQIQARLRDNREQKSVRVMHLQGNFSSVSLTSFIANTLLKSKFRKYVNLFLFVSAKVFPMLVLDFLLLPGVLLKSTRSVPSTYFTKSVLLSTYESCSKGMLVCFVVYVVRCVCLCFCKSPLTWAPGFVFRKHFLCFVRGCYVTQLLPTNCDCSPCSECKEERQDCPQEIDIPGNILRNDLSFDQIFMKVRKDVFCHLLPVLLPEPEYTKESSSLTNNDNNRNDSDSDLNSNTNDSRNFTLHIEHCLKFIWKLICYICVSILFIILFVLDLALSSPIVSFCFPRVWFTVYWFENDRLTQFLFLLFEYTWICCSIAWGVYFSYCCAVSLEEAAASLLMTFVGYGIETILTYAIIIIFWYHLWVCYRTFLDKYDNLNLMLHNACTEDHEEQIKQYQKGDGKVYFPEDLVVSVHKLIPLRESKIMLGKNIICCAVMQILFLLMLNLIERPSIEVRSVAVTFLAVVLPLLKFFFCDRGKLKELEDADLKQNVKELVGKYFKQKIE